MASFTEVLLHPLFEEDECSFSPGPIFRFKACDRFDIEGGSVTHCDLQIIQSMHQHESRDAQTPELLLGEQQQEASGNYETGATSVPDVSYISRNKER